MRIIIRAVRERAEFIAYLQRELPSAEWCFDERRDAMDTFLRALNMAGDDPVVHMEEDVILCKGFLEKLEREIAARPENVVQFFSMRKADLEIGSRWDNNFLAALCFYLPAGYSRQILSFYDVWPRKAEHPTGLDLTVCDWLKARKEKYWIHVPNLVDHRIAKSAINPKRSTKRQSLTFNVL